MIRYLFSVLHLNKRIKKQFGKTKYYPLLLVYPEGVLASEMLLNHQPDRRVECRAGTDAESLGYSLPVEKAQMPLGIFLFIFHESDAAILPVS